MVGRPDERHGGDWGASVSGGVYGGVCLDGGVTLEDVTSALLLPEEAVLWSAQAENGFMRRFIVVLFFLVFGVFCIGCSVIMAWSSLSATPILGTQTPPFLSIVGSFVMGALAFWSALSKRAFLPAPKFSLTQKRAITTAWGKHQAETIARFVEPGRAVRVVNTGRTFQLDIPVRSEAGEVQGFVTFDRLTKAEIDAALVVVNQSLGAPAK